MSQLNPDAAEFVPVSPTRSIPSPICKSLINDEVISQSPKRPAAIDINVPQESEFTKEVKSRPSEVDTFSDQNDSNVEEEGNISSPTKDATIIENLLNGKSIEDIPEFQPSSTPSKVTTNEEFHFGPNAAPFTPSKSTLDQSEAALSTKAVCGDDTHDTLNSSFCETSVPLSNKESDPMSASFYAEKGDNGPFEDLNRVHKLPEDLDEFLKKEDTSKFDDTISDLPEHNPLGVDQTKDITVNNDDAIQTTDLDKPSDVEKELASPLETEKDLDEQLEAKSPQPTQENLFGDDFCQMSNMPGSESTLPEVKLLEFEQNEVDLLGSSRPESENPDSCEMSKLPVSQSPDVCLLPDSVSPDSDSVQPQSPNVCNLPNSITTDIQQSDSSEICNLSKSNICDNSIPYSPTCDIPESPVLDQKDQTEYQQDEITSSVKDDVSSPVQDLLSPSPAVETQQIIEDNLTHNEAVPAEMILNVSESNQEVPEQIQVPTELPNAQPDSITGDINYSIENSKAQEGTENESKETNNDQLPLDHPLSRCVYPLPPENTGKEFDIKTENITPQFAEQTIVSPQEELKPEVPSVPLLEGLSQEQSTVAEAIESLKAPEVVTEPKVETKQTVEKEEVRPKNEGKKDVKPSAAAPKKPSVTAKTSSPTPKMRTSTGATKTSTTRLSTSPTKTMATKTGTAKPAPTAASKPASTLSSKPAMTKPAPKPKTPTSKLTEKKPAVNGDVKKPAAPIKRTTLETKPPTSRLATTTASKTTPTRPATTAPRPATAPAPRPAAPRTALSAPKPRAATATASAKTTVAAARNGIGATTTKVTASAPKTSNPVPKPAATPRPKPPATISSMKPRVPLTKTVTKSAPDMEKQSKESANKLTASRTVTSTRTATSATAKPATARKVESKVMTTRTTVLKTTTTTAKSTTAKKPIDASKNPKSKTTTTKIEKPKENGVATTVTEEIKEITDVNNAVNASDNLDLLKDNSPVDNKLLIENTLIQTNAAD